jgi:mono/diheme cytochrome c family protein
MKPVTTILVLPAVLFAVASAASLEALAEEAKCDENEPGCSLQRWMANHVQAALQKKDLDGVGRALQIAANSAPDPRWNQGQNGWAAIAKAGAAAAQAGNMSAVRKACKSCHEAYRDDYKKQYRARPIFGDAAHGAEVFEEHCDICHPSAGEGVGPSLLGKPASAAHIRKQVREGSARMVSFSEQRLNQRDLNAVIAYLLSRNPADTP